MNEYKYIYFTEVLPERLHKTSTWICRNKRTDSELGIVRWYPSWRQYCYFPAREAVYSAGCLDDISDFIKTKMKEKNEK